jgi:uncharacterized protein YndB with AHSA1/START domain
MTGNPTVLRRTFPARPETVWDLWTTPAGIGQWWAPNGFVTQVRTLDLRVGGSLVYTTTAVAPAQDGFMAAAGARRSSTSRKTFTELDAPRRLAYLSLIDFVPDHEPYQHLTEVTLRAAGDHTDVTMTLEPLHDPEWTYRLIAGRTHELENLAALLERSAEPFAGIGADGNTGTFGPTPALHLVFTPGAVPSSS